jgi:hypothetical protein
MMRIFAIGAVIAAICAVPAYAQTTPTSQEWICTWTRPGDQRPTILHLRVEGDNLLGVPYPLGYRIVTNNPDGIVAVYSVAALEPTHSESLLGAEVIMLDKRFLAFRVLNMYLRRPGVVDSGGPCIKG